jgi:hypothetical protein
VILAARCQIAGGGKDRSPLRHARDGSRVLGLLAVAGREAPQIPPRGVHWPLSEAAHYAKIVSE